MFMCPATRSRVSGKADVSTVGYTDIRQVVMGYTSPTSATGQGGRGNSAPTAMDIGSIASVADGEEENRCLSMPSGALTKQAGRWMKKGGK